MIKRINKNKKLSKIGCAKKRDDTQWVNGEVQNYRCAVTVKITQKSTMLMQKSTDHEARDGLAGTAAQRANLLHLDRAPMNDHRPAGTHRIRTT